MASEKGEHFGIFIDKLKKRHYNYIDASAKRIIIKTEYAAKLNTDARVFMFFKKGDRYDLNFRKRTRGVRGRK